MFNKLKTKLEGNEKLIYRRVSLFLLSFSILIWAISIYFSRLNIGAFGLIHGLHPLFFVSVFLLTISFFITIKHSIENNALLILHLFCMILFFSSIPILIEGTPRFTYNYQTYYHVDYILKYGHSNLNLLPYQSWPGIFYFASILTQVTGISPTGLLLFIPIIFGIVNIPLSFLLYSTLLNSKKEVWTVFLLGSVAFWGAPILFVPGVLGIIMAMYAITILLRFELLKTRTFASINAIVLIFFIACIFSHLLSSVILLIIMIFFYTLRFVFKRYIVGLTRNILYIVLLISWQIYVIGPFAFNVISDALGDLFNFALTLSEISEMGFAGSEAHTIVVNIRIITALMLLSLAAIGFLYEIVKKRKITFKTALLPIWIVANFMLILLTSYSGEILSRVFSYNNAPFQILAAKNITRKILSIILLIFLLIYPPLSIINAYGNEAVDYVSPAEISGVDFFSNHSIVNAGIATLERRIWGYRYSENISYVNLAPDSVNWDFVADGRYTLIGERDITGYVFLRGYIDVENLKNIGKSQFHNKIYASKEFDLYKEG